MTTDFENKMKEFEKPDICRNCTYYQPDIKFTMRIIKDYEINGFCKFNPSPPFKVVNYAHSCSNFLRKQTNPKEPQ